MLIVCEGSKTEPHYFEEIRQDLRLQVASVKVCGKECGSDPVSVFKYAQKAYEAEDCAYDTVYCVIDTDSHSNLNAALAQIKSKGSPYVAIVSSPCFEYWLILHYELHQKAFSATSKKSIGDVVGSALRKHDKSYSKGKPGVWARYKGRLPTALNNSKIVLKTAKKNASINPSTEIHLVVEAMMSLRG